MNDELFEKLYTIVFDQLMQYECQNTQLEEDNSSGLPLIDKLCSPNENTIDTGREEIYLLTEDICIAIMEYFEKEKEKENEHLKLQKSPSAD